LTFGKLCLAAMLVLISGAAIHANAIFATSPAACASVDGSVGFNCPGGVAETNSDPAINGYGFYINPFFRQFNGGRGNPNGAAPLGVIVDGSHDPSSPDGTSGCAGVTVNQHCETLVFASDAFATYTPAGSTVLFNWDNISLALQDFSGPNGAYIDQYFVTYVIIQNGITVVDWSSAPVNFTQTGKGTSSGPRTELNLSGSGFTTLGTTLSGNETVEVGLTIGWVWLGPQTGTPASAGNQGPGIDLDIGIGKGSLDIGLAPEPSSIALSGLGLALVSFAIRRRKQVARASACSRGLQPRPSK
jgi:hypothetical protein